MWFVFCSANIHAQTVYFSTSDPGVTKAMTEWGADTAWPSSDNMRQCIAHMGADEIDVIRINFFTDEALVDGEIGPNSRGYIDNQLAIAAMAGDKPLALTPSSGNGTDPWYMNGTEVWPDRWVALLEATQRYINKPIAAVEPFNEPDYWAGQGTPQNLYDILVLLQSSPYFQGTELHAASTLSSDLAQWWYDQIAGPTTHGTTHQLAGSTDSYVNFIQHVIANGDIAYNPEIHSLAEVIYGAEYGLSGGIWWADALRPRGLFVRSCQGKRLGYAENRGTQSAAAVYRAPDGELYGFAGSFEREGAPTSYRFVCTDRDVYYNGIGPVREFMVPVHLNEVQGSFVNIDYDTDILPALDGNRWEIVNRDSGEVLEVASAGTADGDNIQTAPDTDGLHQKWDIVRTKEGYYRLFNANSGRTAEIQNWALWNGANVQQWGHADNFPQHWYIEDAGGGYYYLRNGHSTMYMDGDLGSNNVIQWDGHGGLNQQWQFVLANPGGSLAEHYEFEGNANDSAGTNNGTTIGSPAYSVGQIGRAIDLDGVDDYVDLPNGVGNSDDITIAAWVNWDGGAAWQRIFDFGTDTTSYMFLTPSALDGMMHFAITTDGSSNEEMLITDQLPIGRWVHVAVTLSGNTAILYIDGAPRVAGMITLNPSDVVGVAPQNNYIGKSQWPDALFDGRVDDFRIYDYALSAAGVSALVNATVRPAGVVSWNCDYYGTVESASIAGVVPVANWNNSWPNDPVIDLVDQNGNATTVDIDYSSFNQYSILLDRHPGPDSDGTNNKEMLNGYLNSGSGRMPARSSVFISDIPFGSYDIYVYFSSDAAGRTGTVTDGTTIYSFSTIGTPSVSGANAVLTRTTDTGAGYPDANYAVFSGLSGNSKTITCDVPLFGGIAAFQIVPDAGSDTSTAEYWTMYQ